MQVHHILDELILAGLVIETSVPILAEGVAEQNKIVKSESPLRVQAKKFLAKTKIG